MSMIRAIGRPPVQILIAACSGTARVSGAIGLPLVHVDATPDPIASLRALNQRSHGCGVRWPGSFQSLDLEPGWRDWSEFRLDRGLAMTVGAPLGVRVARGRVTVPLPADVTVAEFRSQLAGALRHLRLQEVTIRADYLEARSRASRGLVVHPRYTPPRAADCDHRDAALVTDIYAIDPAEHGWRLFWLVVAAKAAAVEGRTPHWR